MGRFHQRWEIFDDIRTCKTFWDVLLRLIRFDMENKICSKGKSSTPKWCFFSVISIAMLDNMFKRQIIDPSWCFFSIAMFVRLFLCSLTEFIPGERNVVNVATIYMGPLYQWSGHPSITLHCHNHSPTAWLDALSQDAMQE